MDVIKLEYEDVALAAETAEALANNGFIVETHNDGQVVTLIALRV